MANAREATLHRVNAIKAGIITESTKSELVRLEAEPARLQQAVHGPFKNGSAKQLLTDLKGGFRNIVGNLASLASRNIEKTRGAIKDLLGSDYTPSVFRWREALSHGGNLWRLYGLTAAGRRAK